MQRQLANAAYEVARLQLALGQYQDAAHQAQHALEGFESLYAIDGSNAEWLAQMTLTRVGLIEMKLALKDRRAAQDHLERAVVDSARLRAIDGTQIKWNVALPGLVLLQRLVLGGDRGPLQRDVEDYLTTVQRIEAGGKRLDADQTRIVATTELRLGDLMADVSQRADAKAHWLAAVQRLQPAAMRNELPSLTLLAHARLRLGELQEARHLAQRIEASPYRPPVYADLRQQLAHAVGAAPAHP